MSQSDRRSRINWPSTLTEVGLILVGLLLAFSADRIWEDRQDRIREFGHVARLHEDFTATAASLDTLIAHQDTVLQAGQVVLEAMADPSAPDASLRFAEALPVVFDFWSPRIYTSAYGELQNSGDLSQIQDQELRLTLAEFESLLEGSLAQREDLVRDEWIHRVRPVLESRLSSDLYLPQRPEDETHLGIPRSPFHTDLREIMSDLELWNLIVHRLIVAGGSKEVFVKAREVAGRVMNLSTP